MEEPRMTLDLDEGRVRMKEEVKQSTNMCCKDFSSQKDLRDSHLGRCIFKVISDPLLPGCQGESQPSQCLSKWGEDGFCTLSENLPVDNTVSASHAFMSFSLWQWVSSSVFLSVRSQRFDTYMHINKQNKCYTYQNSRDAYLSAHPCLICVMTLQSSVPAGNKTWSQASEWPETRSERDPLESKIFDPVARTNTFAQGIVILAMVAIIGRLCNLVLPREAD